MQSKFVFITATMVVVMVGLIGGTALPASAAGEDTLKPLVISAVQITGGMGRTSEDYIELFNPNPTPFNLKDYRLVKRTATATIDTSIKSWTSDTFVPPYSFYLWANSAFSGITKVPDLTSTATLADNNGVAIRKGLIDTGELVDSLSWGTTTNGFNSSGIANPSGEHSVVRDSLFGTSTYSLQVSNPRNSTIQQLPMDPVDPSDDPPVLADDALCAIAEPSRIAEPNSTIVFDLEFKNNGTTQWTGLDYSLLASDGNNLTFPAESVIRPDQNWITSVELVAPLTEGLYSYQWQMANNGIGFGASCVLSLTVQPVIPVEDPPPTDDPPVEEPPTDDPPTEDPPPIEPPSVVLPTIKITEILPNPKGKDSGRETIELYNYGTQSVVVDSWVLDNILPNQDLSSKAFTFSNLTIEPNEYFSVTVPAGKFVLNNTKGGVVTLFDGEEQVIDSVSYSTKAPEGKSYANINGTWKWLDPSFGIQNFEPTVEPDKEQEESTKKEPNKEKTTVTTRAKTKVASKTEKSLKTKTATKTSVKSSKAKAVVKKAAKATAKKAKALDSKTSETNKRPSNKPKTKSEAKSESKPEAQTEKPKSSGAAGSIAIAIASLSAGGLAVYRFGMGGGL